MKSIMLWLTKPPVDGPRSVLLLRLMVGGVFFWEGVLKFVYANQGVGRFTKLGMPFPAFTADFVGCLEIVGGLLLLLGLLTRLVAIPFVIEMIVAMLSTKISMYFGTSPLPLPPGELLLKKFAGNRFGAEKASGTPSQLISRRPVGNVPPTPLLGPKKFLKASTAVWMSAGVAPDASNTSGSAEAATGLKMSVKPKLAIASESQCFFIIFSSMLLFLLRNRWL